MLQLKVHDQFKSFSLLLSLNWVDIPKTIDMYCQNCDKVCETFKEHVITECKVSRAKRASLLIKVSTILEQNAFDELQNAEILTLL